DASHSKCWDNPSRNAPPRQIACIEMHPAIFLSLFPIPDSRFPVPFAV
ncbi:MAG: hypothetical protein F6K65_34095, partial [Moorea sp. SIO3C2]|nr:hypothetical protein [Moorena sp. SIO3C2]